MESTLTVHQLGRLIYEALDTLVSVRDYLYGPYGQSWTRAYMAWLLGLGAEQPQVTDGNRSLALMAVFDTVRNRVAQLPLLAKERLEAELGPLPV